MSDSPWQSPSGSEPDPAAGGFGGPQPPPPPPPSSPAGGPVWTPPPRPGLIPLAPLGLGGILGASFRVLRRNPRPVVGFSLVIRIVVAILTVLVQGILTAHALNTYLNDATAGNFAGSLAALLPSEAATFVVGLVGYVGDAILQGIITVEVARGTLGEKLTLRGLFARARGRLGLLVVWAFLVIGAVLFALVIYGGIIVVLIAYAGTTGTVIGIILIVVGFLGSIAIWIWIGTKISMVPSVLVLERLTLGKAIRRSWRLTTGYFYFWRTFGIELLVAVMLAIAASIVAFPFGVIIGIISAISNPLGTTGTSSHVTLTIATIVSAGIGALTGTITAIVITANTALLYIDLRIRKEGLDLDLMRFVDARAAGSTDLPDPYLPSPPPAQ